MDVIKRLRSENPNLSVAELERLAASWLFTEVPKSRAFYRIQVGIRQLNLMKSHLGDSKNDRPWGHYDQEAARTGRGRTAASIASHARQAKTSHRWVREYLKFSEDIAFWQI